MTNTWLTTEGQEQVVFYTSSADVIIVERLRTMGLLADFIGHHFEDRNEISVLDLGCGDGTLTKFLQNRYPGNQYYLMDGSDEMLEKAKVLCGVDKLTFIKKTFEEYIEEKDENIKFDCIFSSNAIHHLDYNDKAKLFSKAHRELNFNGMFVVIDLVLPSSEKSEQWQFKMWTNWMTETIKKHGLEKDLTKHDNLPQVYKEKAENKPSSLIDQLQLMRRVGFRDVDCYYKYGLFSMFGGCK